MSFLLDSALGKLLCLLQLLTALFCSEKDAQMCLYHISWQSKFGFCCDLDEKCAEELAGL